MSKRWLGWVLGLAAAMDLVLFVVVGLTVEGLYATYEALGVALPIVTLIVWMVVLIVLAVGFGVSAWQFVLWRRMEKGAPLKARQKLLGWVLLGAPGLIILLLGGAFAYLSLLPVYWILGR